MRRVGRMERTGKRRNAGGARSRTTTAGNRCGGPPGYALEPSWGTPWAVLRAIVGPEFRGRNLRLPARPGPPRGSIGPGAPEGRGVGASRGVRGRPAPPLERARSGLESRDVDRRGRLAPLLFPGRAPRGAAPPARPGGGGTRPQGPAHEAGGSPRGHRRRGQPLAPEDRRGDPAAARLGDRRAAPAGTCPRGSRGPAALDRGERRLAPQEPWRGHAGPSGAVGRGGGESDDRQTPGSLGVTERTSRALVPHRP